MLDEWIEELQQCFYELSSDPANQANSAEQEAALVDKITAIFDRYIFALESKPDDTAAGELMGLIFHILMGDSHTFGNRKQLRGNPLYSCLVRLLEMPSIKINPIGFALRCIIEEDYRQAAVHIEQELQESEKPIGLYTLNALMVVLREGYPGMWTAIADYIDRQAHLQGISETCRALEDVYHSNDQQKTVDLLSKAVMVNPQETLACEILGYVYYNVGEWKNAIACMEKVIDTPTLPTFFYRESIYFWLAYAYGKCKQWTEEESGYRKLLELDEQYPNALNNLGYCLYKQKRYDQAETIFRQCVGETRDFPYSANNLVRTLIAQGKNTEARKYAKQFAGHIQKTLREKVEQLGQDKEVLTAPMTKEYGEKSPSNPQILQKQYQFTSERILEDELIERMEKGIAVFGIPLRIYEERGAYGRQFIIPIGRLDILAVDQHDNLYVIELKKDSGYSDPYSQAFCYMDWIEEHMARKGQKVYGIICLNEPSTSLIETVRQNPRMELYEYTVSYRKID